MNGKHLTRKDRAWLRKVRHTETVVRICAKIVGAVTLTMTIISFLG